MYIIFRTFEDDQSIILSTNFAILLLFDSLQPTLINPSALLFIVCELFEDQN